MDRPQEGDLPEAVPSAKRAHVFAAPADVDRSVDDRMPIVVSTSGPPGIGQTRLGQEILAKLERHSSPPRVMLVRCESYSRSQSLGTACDALRSLVLLPRGATLEEAQRAIDAACTTRTHTSEMNLLARLLSNSVFPDGVDPRALRDALAAALPAELPRLVAGRWGVRPSVRHARV